ncbi:hypothetical protein ACIPC1_13200 [Streptomyces sp. NPDC087263]|uniref:hypothetical protein n=1 Tax=Streptomyces sp. NPDC087263 TaxID=3365773 RepID=UPI0037F4A558
MSPKRDSDTPSQLEQDAIDVLLWFGPNAGRELSYADISRGTGIPDGSRLRRAVPRARAAAHVLGHRLEQFMHSRDPLKRGARVTRFHKSGQGDEFGARDALLACRKAVAYMGDMHRACSFEAGNPNSVDREAFGQMPDAAEGGIRTLKLGMPRSATVFRRARSVFIWESFSSAPVRLTCRPSISPSQPSRSASAMRSRR